MRRLYTLEQTQLTNVDDKAGRWQYQGGDVVQAGKKVGVFIAVRRVLDNLAPDFNGATYTATLLFSGSTPAQNLTIQGSWDYSGSGCGSVSAISEDLEGADGANYTIEGDQLLIKAVW